MTPLPVDLPTTTTATEWWVGLSENDRTELTALFDPRQEDCFFGADAADDDPPTVRGGRFIPHDDAWGFSEWGEGWLEYVLEHPEVIEVWTVRTFHICTRHPAARAAVAAGRIPADFACPFASADCPMRRLVDGGQSLRLVGVRGPNGARRVIALPTV